MSSMEYCSDIFFEVLSRCCLKTLDRLRVVSKEWNHITYESTFMPLHTHRTNTISGYFIQSRVWNENKSQFVSIDVNQSHDHDHDSATNISLDFLPNNIRILASCRQGLLCCVSTQDKYSRYYVCKPSTKEFRALPNPKLRYKMENVALVVLRSNPLRYKIFRLTFHSICCINSKEYYKYRCEIFDSEVSRWKNIEILSPYGTIFCDHDPDVVVRGTVHWLTTNNQILAINENDYTYTMFSIPKPVYHNDSSKYNQIMEYEGKLAFTCMTPNGHFELWVMEDYKNRVWEKRRLLNIEPLREEEHNASLETFYNSDIALVKGYNKVIFYEVQNSSFSVVKLNQLRNICKIFPFRSDVEPANFRSTSC